MIDVRRSYGVRVQAGALATGIDLLNSFVSDRRWRFLPWALPLLGLLVARASGRRAAGCPTGIDPAKVAFYPDQGRVEIVGANLARPALRWEMDKGSGIDSCAEPIAAGKRQACSFAVPRDLPADVRLSWALPSGPARRRFRGLSSRPSNQRASSSFGCSRRRRTPSTSAAGWGESRSCTREAVAEVDCAQARCELGETAIEARAISAAATGLTVHVHLAPHFFVLRNEATDNTFTQTLAVLHCPAEVVSGPPLRRADAASLLVRLGGRCGADPRGLRWTANGEAATIVQTAPEREAVLVLLSIGDIEDATLTVTAARPEADGAVVAVAHTPTRPAPAAHATLEIPGHGSVDFVPTNRDALVHVAPVGGHARLVVLPQEGAYRVSSDINGTRVRGEEGAGGFVALRFGYRVDGLPPPFAATDLAILSDSLQRPIHEASVPAPIGPSALGADPLVELLCTEEHGQAQRIVPGNRTSIPFSRRDGCRVVIHRERFKPQDGTQDLTVDVDVTKLDDSSRSDAHVSERMVLRPSPEPRIFWIRGVKAQFDRVTVRVAHVADDARYLDARESRTSLPAAQWTLIVERAVCGSMRRPPSPPGSSTSRPPAASSL